MRSWVAWLVILMGAAAARAEQVEKPAPGEVPELFAAIFVSGNVPSPGGGRALVHRCRRRDEGRRPFMA